MNQNQTPKQILDAATEEMHRMVGVFVQAYGFYPIRPGSERFEQLSLNRRKLAAAFFNHKEITNLEDEIHNWNEQMEMLNHVR